MALVSRLGSARAGRVGGGRVCRGGAAAAWRVGAAVAGPGDGDQVGVAHRVGHRGLFEEPEEQQPAGTAGAPVEAEGELVEVVLEVGGGDPALMGADARQRATWYSGTSDEKIYVDLTNVMATPGQAGTSLKTVPRSKEQR